MSAGLLLVTGCGLLSTGVETAGPLGFRGLAVGFLTSTSFSGAVSRPAPPSPERLRGAAPVLAGLNALLPRWWSFWKVVTGLAANAPRTAMMPVASIATSATLVTP